jgi:glycosyltransferase involved in cell wall biosynthesis
LGNPLVSVLMTAYNREQYIAEAIESVLASTYTNFELIIVDDCSIDNTVKIAKNFEDKDSRIKVYVNDKNLGDYPNRNKAASYACGKYLKYLDSDDKIYPDGLNYCVQNMEKFINADWAIIFSNEISKENLLNSKEAIESHFFKQPFLKIGPGGTIINRNFFYKIGMYPTIYGPANDMYFNLLAASMGNVLLLKDNFLFYRIHEGQEINNQYSYLYNNCKYLKDALENLHLPLTKKQIKWLQQKRKRRFAVNIITYILKTRNIEKAKQAILKAEFSFKDFLIGIFHFYTHP